MAKEDRGFASMDRDKQREIASKGGKAAHEKGTAHQWTSDEARNAGRKGGLASHRARRMRQGLPGRPGRNEYAAAAVERRQPLRDRSLDRGPAHFHPARAARLGPFRVKPSAHCCPPHSPRGDFSSPGRTRKGPLPMAQRPLSSPTHPVFFSDRSLIDTGPRSLWRPASPGRLRSRRDPIAALYPPTMFLSTNSTLAGRSASRRMYHGNHTPRS